MIRIASALLAGVLSLPGCVNVPHNDQLLSLRGGEIVRTYDADCGKGWLVVPTTSEQSVALDPAGFSLLTWNVHKAQAEEWPDEYAQLSAGQDLVLLQEAHLTPLFRAAVEQSGRQWAMVRAFDYNGAETGVLTASGVPASAACVSRIAEPLIRTPKSALLTRYPLDGDRDELWVANLHGVNFTLGTTEFRAQLRSLDRLLESHDGPLVLAGDFNNWSQGRSDILGATADRLRLTALTLAEDGRTRHLGKIVDLVFYRGVEVLEASSLAVSSSDHNPVLVTFRLPGFSQERGQE